MRSVLHAQPWLAVADINSMLRGTRKDDINLSPVDDMSECWGEPIAAGPNHLLSTCSFCTVAYFEKRILGRQCCIHQFHASMFNHSSS